MKFSVANSLTFAALISTVALGAERVVFHQEAVISERTNGQSLGLMGSVLEYKNFQPNRYFWLSAGYPRTLSLMCNNCPGGTAWTYDTGGDTYLFYQDSRYVGIAGGESSNGKETIQLLDSSTGKLLWEREALKEIFPLDSERFVMQSDPSEFEIFSIHNGASLGKYSTSFSKTLRRLFVASGGTLIAETFTPQYNPQYEAYREGKRLWQATLPVKRECAVDHVVETTPNTLLMTFEGYFGYHCEAQLLDLNTGIFKSVGEVYFSLATGPQDQVFARTNRSLKAMKRSALQTQWEIVGEFYEVLAVGDLVVAERKDGTWVAIDPVDGQILGSHPSIEGSYRAEVANDSVIRVTRSYGTPANTYDVTPELEQVFISIEQK